MRTKSICLLFGLAVSSVACDKDLLEEEVFTFQAPQGYYSNPEEVVASTNGIYDALMTWDMWVSPAWNSIAMENDDMLAFDWVGGGYTGVQNGTWYIERPWKGFYQVVNRANTVINRVTPLEFLTEDQKNAALGQAYFLRGYCYYEIAHRFGDAPIRVKAFDPATDSPDIARSPQRDVFLQAAKDLKLASTLLPGNYASGTYTAQDGGRPTSASALGLASKVYMHLAGAEVGEPAYYADALAAAEQVIEMADGGFPALESNYMTLFDQSLQDQSSEILFSIQATQAPNEGPELPRFHVPGNTSFAGGGGIGAISLREDFYRTFDRNDKRVELGTAIFDEWTDLTGVKFYNFRALPSNIVSIVSENVVDNGFGRIGDNVYILPDSTEIRGTPRLYIKKYVDETSQVKDENGSNPIILRYADVLLLAAEAQNEIGGPDANAYDYVNQVRSRAGLENLEENLSQDSFRVLVHLERRHELYGEFQRRNDLIRWGTWLEVMNAANRPRLDYQRFFPIAAEEIAANTQISTNNPGW